MCPNVCLKSEKIRYILPKLGKESVDLPDFVKDSVAILQILLTFWAIFVQGKLDLLASVHSYSRNENCKFDANRI